MDVKGLSCSMCHSLYGDDCLPRQLGCGHSTCTLCIKTLIAQDSRCPECQIVFKANTASDIVVNYQLLKIIQSVHKTLSSKQEGASNLKPDLGVCETHGSPYSKRCFTCRVWVCGDCLTHLHKTPPQGSCRIPSFIEAVKEINKEQKKMISEKIGKLQDFRSKTEEYVAYINMTKSIMEDNITRLSTLLREEEEYFQHLEQKRRESVVQHTALQSHIESLEEVASQVTRAKTMHEVITVTTERSEMLGKAERCIVEEDMVQAQLLTALNTRGIGNLKTTLMMREHVYASHVVHGRQRWSRVIFQDNLVHLHALQNFQPPSTAVIVPFTTMRDLVPTKCQPTVFLDVGFPSCPGSRVYIQLSRNSPQLLHFLLLCSGESGSTLQQTKSIEVVGKYAEKKISGKILLRDTVLGPIDHGSCHRYNVQEGHLTAELERNSFGYFFLTGMRYSFHFNLLINGDHMCTGTEIGKITKGLDLLKNAVFNSYIAGVSIKDCGLIVPFA